RPRGTAIGAPRDTREDERAAGTIGHVRANMVGGTKAGGTRRSEVEMHKASIDKDGAVRCREGGSDSLLAQTNERNKRTKHLKWESCGEHQRYREPKSSAKSSAPDRGRAPVPTAMKTGATAGPTIAPTNGSRPPLARISWRPPDA